MIKKKKRACLSPCCHLLLVDVMAGTEAVRMGHEVTLGGMEAHVAEKQERKSLGLSQVAVAAL